MSATETVNRELPAWNPHEGNRRVLVVDDNEGIHEGFRKILAAPEKPSAELANLEAALFGGDRGAVAAETPVFELDSAYQGEEAIERVCGARQEGRPYATAFIDVRMPPGMDGIETTSHLLTADPEIGIVICSAYSDHSWEEMLAAFGKTDRVLILRKPFDSIEVRQLAYALQRRWELAQQAALKLDDLEALAELRARELTTANESLRDEAIARERMEQELRLAQKLEAIGQLAAGIAHEINTPIQYIGDNTHFLESAVTSYHHLLAKHAELLAVVRDGGVDEGLMQAVQEEIEAADIEYLVGEVPRAIQQTLEGVQQVAKIVLAMKDFSHPGTKERSPVDLNGSLRSTVTVARNEWKYVAEVETELDPGLPEIMGFGAELNQVFLNILVNGAHAIANVVGDGSEGKGIIKVSTRAVADWVEVEISDTGAGIPNHIQERIFEPFFTTKAIGKGTGQGLAIARKVVVEHHQGELDFASEPGQGTTFTIRLPVGCENGAHCS